VIAYSCCIFVQEEGLRAIHSFDDDRALHNILSNSNDLMQIISQLVVKTEQYLEQFSTTAASESGAIDNVCELLMGI